MDPVTVADFAALARAALPADVWDYFDGGSGAERTIAANRAAYDRLALRPRVLTDVSAPSLSTEVLGMRLALPVGFAPTAYQRLAHPDGEVATAAAAGQAGALMVVSFFASQPLADIAAAASGAPLWAQVYWLRQREELAALAGRAADAGCRALVLTVDAPKIARRPRDARNGFTIPPGIAAVNVSAAVMASAHEHVPGVSAIERHSREQFDQSVTWADLAWLRERSPLPLVLKGVVTAEDARLAVEHGVDGLVVSNHGGRQLDGAIATLDALPEVVAAAGRLPVLMDGGVRAGTDVFKALALGARAVLVGRPVIWGLAHAGTSGVSAVLGLLREELTETMLLAGTPRVADITPAAVRAVCGCGAATGPG